MLIENIRMFMLNILDQVGPIVLIGEELEPVTVGEVHLKHPLRIIANGDGTVGVANLLAKEEWVKVPKAMSMEMSIHSKLIDLYLKYEKEVFSSIIMPEEKRIIL